MNCIIIDDELTARAIISKLCSNYDNITVINEFSNAIHAIKFLNDNEVDLIFLDIHMPDFNGFDFIKTLKNTPKIILTTSDTNFAIKAFEYECIVDYLVKPITKERFHLSIQKSKNIHNKLIHNANTKKSDSSQESNLYVNIDRRLIKISISGILFVEAKGDYIHISTNNKNYIVHSTLKNIEEKLPKNLFIKVHRSYIININKIIDIENNSVLINKDVIPVSRSHRSELMKRLNLL